MWLDNEFNAADRPTARCRELQTEVIILMKLIGNNYLLYYNVFPSTQLTFKV